MHRPLRDSIVVITGASSGIGRASARAFAERGATLVLTSRRHDALEACARECAAAGARTLVEALDVTDEAAVHRLAQTAIEQFGRIDVWVNNAALTSFGTFEKTPRDAFRRVIETNLFGYVHGARAVLPYFREQGQGMLINVSTEAALGGQPYASAYVTSKYAIRGFSDSLRQELLGTGIQVCTVLPGSTDTPLFEQGANYTGRAVQPMRPIAAPETVARLVVHVAERPQPEVAVESRARAIAMLRAAAPGIYDRLARRTVERNHFLDATAPVGSGNLFTPASGTGAAEGGWRARQSALRPALIGATAVGALGAFALAGWRTARARG